MPNRQMLDSGPGVNQFFFVRGFARSGTNRLEGTLNLVPRIQCCGEFDLGDVRVELDRTMEERLWTLLLKQNFQPQVRRRFEVLITTVIFDHTRQNGIRPEQAMSGRSDTEDAPHTWESS